MSTALDRYKDTTTQIKLLKLTAKELAKEAIEQGRAALFAKHPHIGSIVWTQYTPYFNDGDTCSFSSNAEYAEVYDANDAALELTDEEMSEDVFGLLGAFEDDDYHAMFGDHQQVTMTADGISTAYYSHD